MYLKLDTLPQRLLPFDGELANLPTFGPAFDLTD